MVGIVRVIRQTTTQLPPQKSSPWCSVYPPYGIDSMNRPNPIHGRPSAGVGQGLLGGVLYKSIKQQRNLFNSTAHLVFNELLASRQKWWPKRHPSLTAGAQTIRID
jgi:hypothetical protein